MVQIIQSGPSAATLRQQALDTAIGNIAGGLGTMAKDKKDADLLKAKTLREQALADQQTNIKLAEMGVDANAQDLRDFGAGKYKPKEITPAVPAKDAVTEQQQIAGPTRPGEDLGSISKIIQEAQPAQAAVMGPANPLQNYTTYKQAQIKAAQDKILLDKQTAEAGITNKQADTSKKQAEEKFIREQKPAQVAAQVSLAGQRENLIDSQISKNAAAAANGGISASQQENNIFKESRLLNQAAKPYKTQVDAADKIDALANSQLGGGAKANETREQRIARYNQADSRQVSEIVKAMDKMLSGAGASTVSGQEHLTPVTFEGLAQKFGEKVTGDPRGVNQGEFVDRMLESVHIEKKLNQQKLDEVTSGSEARLAGLKKTDPERFNQLIRGYNPAYGKGQQATINPATGQQHPQVKQNGVVYNWNAQTGAYE